MTDKISDELRTRLEAALNLGIDDKSFAQWTKKIKSLSEEFEESLVYSLKDNLAHTLSHWVADLAGRAVEQLLAGNEDQMRRYLSCDKRGPDGTYNGYNGRSDGVTYGAKRGMEEWHQVIHGELHEGSIVELRRKIFEANRDLIVNERVRDLEDQVKSLVAQVNKSNEERDRARLRALS